MATEVLRIELQSSGEAQTTASLRRTGDSVERLQTRIAGLKTAARGFQAILVGAVVGGLARMTSESLAATDAVGKFADKIGASTEFVSELRLVTELSEVSFQNFQKAIENSTIRIEEAAQGTGQARDALEQLGLSAQELVNLSPDEQFQRIAEAVDETGISLNQAADIFGRSGTEIVKILNQGSEAIADMRQQARDLGQSLSRDQVQAAARANDAIARLTRAFGGLFDRIVLLVAGPLETLATWLTNAFILIGRVIDRIKEWGSAFSDLARDALELVGINIAVADTGEEVATATTKSARSSEVAGRTFKRTGDIQKENLVTIEAVTSETYELVDADLEAANAALEAFDAQQKYNNSLIDASAHVRAFEEAQERSIASTRRQTQALSGLQSIVGSIAQLAGIVSPEGLGAIRGLIGGVGQLFNLSDLTTGRLGAAGGIGGLIGGVTGGGGVGATLGGAAGGIAGLFAGQALATAILGASAAGGPLGLAIGAIVAAAGAAGGGFLGGLFGSNQPTPAVELGTTPVGFFGAERGPVGQRTTVATGAFGSVFVGGRQGQGRTPEMQQLADRIATLDDLTAEILDEEQLSRATNAARAFRTEVEASTLNASQIIQLRFDDIFDAIGGDIGALFDAFKPRGDTIEQVIRAVSVLTELGETSQWVARQFMAADEAFLTGIASLAEIERLISEEDPIGRIKEGIEDLTRTTQDVFSDQAVAVSDLAQSFDASLQSTIDLAQGMLTLDQAMVSAVASIEAARGAVTATFGGAIQRVRQSGLTPEEIFQENITRSQDIIRLLASGSITSAEEVTRLAREQTQLLTQAFFGLSPERQEEERERILEALEFGAQQSQEALDRQEEQIIATHQAAMEIVVNRMEEVAQSLEGAAAAQRRSADAITEATTGSELAA